MVNLTEEVEDQVAARKIGGGRTFKVASRKWVSVILLIVLQEQTSVRQFSRDFDLQSDLH